MKSLSATIGYSEYQVYVTKRYDAQAVKFIINMNIILTINPNQGRHQKAWQCNIPCVNIHGIVQVTMPACYNTLYVL